MLSENDIHDEWKGKKFFAKSFDVYRLTDILEHMQTVITSIDYKAEKKRGAIFRTRLVPWTKLLRYPVDYSL